MSLPSALTRPARPSRRRRALIAVALLAAAVAVPGLGPAKAAPTSRFTIDNADVFEGNSGTKTMTFTVTLTPPALVDSTVEYFTGNIDAVAGDDYEAEADILFFEAGDTEEQIDITVKGDKEDELDEQLSVRLTNPSPDFEVELSPDAVGIGTIKDDDVGPFLTIEDTEVEKDASGRTATLAVRLYPPASETVTVEFATENITAVAPADYQATAGLLRFSPGETVELIKIPIKGDQVDEGTERFGVRLYSPTNATITSFVGFVDIVDNDIRPSLTIDDVEIIEGNSGTRDAVFTVYLFPEAHRRVTVEYATLNETAFAPADYANTAGLLVFDEGETQKEIRVKIKGDRLDERAERDEDDEDEEVSLEGDRVGETFLIELDEPTGAVITDDIGRAIIVDDDLTPQVSVSDASVQEGDSGQQDMVFEVTVFPEPGNEVRVDYQTEQSTAVTPDDYRATGGILIFQPGERTKTVVVKVKGDHTEEADEEFFLAVDNAHNAELDDRFGTGVILDDDQDPSITVTDASVSEGPPGATSQAVFFVFLSEPSQRPVTFRTATRADTAVSPSDYTASGGTLSIAPGETHLRVTVPVIGDALEEDDETFDLTISDSVNGIIADSTGRGIIFDDDRPGAARVGMASTSTGDGYWIAAADGDVFNFGDAPFFGSLNLTDSRFTRASVRPAARIVGIEGTRNDRGYWLASADGGVFAFGNARFFGSAAGLALNQPIVDMAVTPSGDGYWLVAADGGIFAFGDATFFGSTGHLTLNRPIVGIASTPDGGGYWLVATDGGVFAFGNARFVGSMGQVPLNRPVVGMAATPSGQGYWMVGSDGGIFNFGDARFRGSTGSLVLYQPVVGMAPTPNGGGYHMVARDGGIFNFGNADFFGSTGGARLTAQ